VAHQSDLALGAGSQLKAVNQMTVGADEALIPEDLSGSDEPRHNSAAVNFAVRSLDDAAMRPTKEITSRTLRKDYGALAVAQWGLMLSEIVYNRFRNFPIS